MSVSRTCGRLQRSTVVRLPTPNASFLNADRSRDVPRAIAIDRICPLARRDGAAARHQAEAVGQLAQKSFRVLRQLELPELRHTKLNLIVCAFAAKCRSTTEH